MSTYEARVLPFEAAKNKLLPAKPRRSGICVGLRPAGEVAIELGKKYHAVGKPQ